MLINIINPQLEANDDAAGVFSFAEASLAVAVDEPADGSTTVVDFVVEGWRGRFDLGRDALPLNGTLAFCRRPGLRHLFVDCAGRSDAGGA